MALRSSGTPPSITDLAWELRPESARIGWTSRANATFSWELRQHDRVLARSSVSSTTTTYAALLRGLAPERRYHVRIHHGQETLFSSEFDTPPIRLLRPAFVAVHERRLLVDMLHDGETPPLLRLQRADGRTQEFRLPGLSVGDEQTGPPIVTLSPSFVGETPSTLAWSIVSHDQILARGSVPTEIRPLDRAQPTLDLQRVALFNEVSPDTLRRPVTGGVLWIGDQLFVACNGGRIVCYEPHRSAGPLESGSPTAVRPVWAFQPPGQVELERAYRNIGGMTALPDGRLLFIHQRESAVPEVWCLDPTARRARWAERMEGDDDRRRSFSTETRFPAWALDDDDPWAAPISTTEWRLPLPEAVGLRAYRPGLMHEGRLIVAGWYPGEPSIVGSPLGPAMQAGWLALDLEARSLAWTSLLPIDESRSAPTVKYRGGLLQDRLPIFAADGEGLPLAGGAASTDERFFPVVVHDAPLPVDAGARRYLPRPTSSVAIAGDTLYTSYNLGTPEAFSSGQDVLLVQRLQNGMAEGEPQAALRFSTFFPFNYLVDDLQRTIQLTTPVGILTWSPDAEESIQLTPLPWAEDGGTSLLAGPVLSLNPGRLLIWTLNFLAPTQYAGLGYERLESGMEVVQIEDDGKSITRRRVGAHEVQVELSVRRLNVLAHGRANDLIVAINARSFFVLSTTNLRANVWTLDILTRRRLVEGALSPDGSFFAGVTDHGQVYLVPPRILLE